jgi:hypothetical protein
VESKRGRIRRVNYGQTAVAVLALSASLAFAEDFKTINGKEYKNATVSHVEPDGIMIKFSGGLVKIPFTDLPQQVQQRFHYNSQEASAYAAEQAASIQRTNQQIEESNKPRREAKQDEPRSSSTAEENDEALPKKISKFVIVAFVCGIIALGAFITKFYLT